MSITASSAESIARLIGARRPADPTGNPVRRMRWQIASVLIVGTIVGVTVWFMIASVIRTERQSALDHARIEANNLSAAFQAEVAGKLDTISRTMDGLTLIVQNNPDIDLHAWFQDHPVLTTLPIQGAGFFSPDGKLRSSSRDSKPPPLDSNDRDFFRVHVDGRGPKTFVSPLFTGRLSGRPGLQISRRINAKDGRFLGVLDFSLSPGQLTTLPRSASLGPNDVLALVGDDHIIRARFDGAHGDGVKGAGARVPAFPPADGAAVQSFVRVSAVDSIERLFSVRTIPDYPLYAAVALDMAEVLRPTIAHARQITKIGIIATLVLTALVMLQIIEIRRRTDQELKLAAEVRLGRDIQKQLTASETRLRDYAVMASDWFWEQDADLRFTEIGIEAPTGVGMGHIGKRRSEVNDTSQAPELWAAHERDLRDRRPFRDFRFGLIGRDGTPRFVSISGIPVFDDAGQFAGYRGTGRDVTEEVRAQGEFREAKARAEQAETLLRDAIDSMSEGFLIYDHEDRLIMCNERFLTAYGRTADMMPRGTTFEDAVRASMARGEFPAAVGREEEWLRERVRQFRECAGSVERQLGNGRWMLVTDRRMNNGGMAGLRIDITALKQTQAQLMESQARLERAQEIAGIGGWELDVATGRYTWSTQMYRMRGVSPDTFQPGLRNIIDTIHPDDREAALRWYEDLVAGREMTALEIRIIRPNGEERIIRVEGRAMIDEDGVVRRVAGTTQDVTERRLIERQLSQAQKMEAIGTLTGGMAHDFNNGLGVIIGNLDLLERMVETDPDAAEVCGEAREAAMRCADLTRGLLAFARRQPLQPRQTDVNALVSDTGRLLGRMLGDDIQLNLCLGAGLWSALADAAQLEAALVNLATNARDAMPKGGELRIATRNALLDSSYVALHPEATQGDYVLIEVSDSGTGIAPDILGRIFEPFFTTKKIGKGTGLGLAMVFGFVKQSGGNIEVYSEPGLGSTFRLYLPRAQTSDARTEIADPVRTARGDGETILLVEDNVKLRELTARHLTELGYRVLTAEDATAALRILASADRIDLLFTDVVMPGAIDGVELACRFEAARPDAGVLLASGFPAGRLPGQQDFPMKFRLLSKPYTLDHLAHTIREAIDERSDDASSGTNGTRPAERAWAGLSHASGSITQDTV